jgi:hypothetical protein
VGGLVSSAGEAAAYPRRLSTRATFVFKFVFPVFVLATLAGVTVAVASQSPPTALLFGVIEALVLALFWRYAWPIKRVMAHPDHLLVSNYLRELAVPYRQIESVREVMWINWHPAIVTLKTPCPFGRSFMYYPAVDGALGGFGRERSATTFLRQHLT